MTPLNKVLIFGGTHGNEWTGIYAIKKYESYFREKFSQLDLHFIHANPEAFKLGQRFKDEDLNRAFQYLGEKRENSYEHNRAREIKSLIDSEPCFVLDLHTTTSNMGNTIIITQDGTLNFFIAKKLAEKLPDCRIILSLDPGRKYLASQSKFGMMIEVGPVANGILSGVQLEGTLKLLEEVLVNLQPTGNLSGSIEVFEEIEDVSYPKDAESEISAYIHPDFQGQDFRALQGKYTPFKTFSGESIELATKEELYPIFINEAAYYPQLLAFTLCRKRILNF